MTYDQEDTMAQTMTAEGSYAGGTMETPRDLMLREQYAKEAEVAAQEVTRLKVELERWERIGRASVRALEALDMHEPIGERTVSDWSNQDKPAASPYPH